MNITSYNVTDVGYHYIGLRVLAGLPPATKREEQTATISKSVRKYAIDRALRLMLPEPRSTFDTAGEKVCQELVHFDFAKSVSRTYELTDTGKTVLHFLNNRQYQELRRIMIKTHLQTYDNLRKVVKLHIMQEGVWRPIVEAGKVSDRDYIAELLKPTFGEKASMQAEQVLSELDTISASKLEDALRNRVLKEVFPETRISESLYKAMCARLGSLRLLNQMKDEQGNCEFDKSYASCSIDSRSCRWYTPLDIYLKSEDSFVIYVCEADMTDFRTQEDLLHAIRKVFSDLTPVAGYYGLPEVRDAVCEYMKIPEAAFDEGLNHLLDLTPCPFTVGLQYEGISGRRKPLVRDRGAVQIYNLLRSA